jgi:KUP system potassium uptake protein
MGKSKATSWTLALLALGVVYGDIGTSPIYALRECIRGRFVLEDDLTILGPVSLMLWSLTIIVTVKYLLLLTRADHQGEGGVFALYSLLRKKEIGLSSAGIGALSLIAVLGAALLYGDGIITPAISVLSAVEGVTVIRPDLPEWVPPVSAAIILFALFMVQRHGTEKIGRGFGPIMLVWFAMLTLIGLRHLVAEPGILKSLSPHYGWVYLWKERMQSMQIMGSVLLAVTGGEALYADIGHFGRLAMKRSWFIAAYPALMLNYLGQGAMLLKLMHGPKPDDESLAQILDQPFFKMVPAGLLLPVVILATLATIIASQAMITGVFSLTQQAVQLNFMPRLKIVHTSPDMRGQVFLPQINFILMVACLWLVASFKKSENLAHAYGLSVSLNMLISTALLFLVSLKLWHWRIWQSLLVCGLFVSIEGAYVLGGLSKFLEGAWFTLLVAGFSLLIMKTWQDGRALLMKRVLRNLAPASIIVDEIKKDKIYRVRGIGVFLSSSADGLPLVLLHHLKHNKVLHETAVVLTVRFEEVPYVPPKERVNIVDLHGGFFRVILHYGFAESPDVRRDLCSALTSRGITRQNDMSYYQSRELLLTDGPGKMARWRKALFVTLSRIARPATGYFQLPPRQVIELGIQLEL